MPIYEYRCTNCGAIAEVLAKSTEDDQPPVACTLCGSDKGLTRLFSAFAVSGSSASGCEQGECFSTGGHSCMGGGCGCGG